MATKTYSLRAKLSTPKHTPTSNTSSDLFDSVLSHSKKSPVSTLAKAGSKSGVAKESKRKGGKSPTKSPIMYSYSYSPSSGMATSFRKESPVVGKSGAKRKSRPKEKAKLTIFDFTSDEESDSAGKVRKVVSDSPQKGRVGKKVVKRAAKKTKDKTAGQSSDGNQISDSEYSSQDSQVQMRAVKPKAEQAKKAKQPTGREKSDGTHSSQGSQARVSTTKTKTKLAEKTKPPTGRQKKTETGSCDVKEESVPAVVSIKRKTSDTSLKATPPKKPRVEPLITPSPGRARVTRSGRLTRSTYRAAALWGEDMEVENASENSQECGRGTDVEDPLCTETTRSVCGSQEGEGVGLEREGGQEESGEKEPSKGREDSQEDGCKGDVVSGFDVLDSDKPSESASTDLGCDRPDDSCTSPLPAPLKEEEELVSDVSRPLPDTSNPTTTETKLKFECEEGEATVLEQPVEQAKHSPSPEPVPSPSRQSDAEVQGSSEDPPPVVVEDWEESQSGSQGGEESMTVDLSLSEPVDEPASRRQFERHLVVPLKKSNSGTASTSKSFPGIDVPSLTRTSSWPRCSGNGKGGNGGKKTGVRCSRQEKELITVVRNVREAHECLEMGESQQFFDEMDYLLDNIAPEQPINVRCLGTCNLATHCLDSEFSRQIRAHGFTDKIIDQLQDSMQHPGLCLSTATLFYVMTRDRFNSEWNKAGVELLVRMLDPSGSSLGADLTGKAAREFSRAKTKARSVLEKTIEEHISKAKSPEEEEKEEEEGEGEEGRVRKKPCTGEHYFRVDVENISVRELSREALLALTSPQHNPHWMREELRIAGGLDHLANMVISGCQELEGSDKESEGGDGREDGERCDGGEGVERRVRVMERVLKTLENVTLMNKDNQSYLVVFDGSLLISKLTRLITVCHTLTKDETIRYTAVDCLLAVMKLLLNLTHDSELGSHRVGEQKGAMEAMLNTIFQLPDFLPEEHHFDVIVLGLGLLINMSEHSAQNRAQLQSTRIDDPTMESSQETAQQIEEDEDIRMMQDDVMGCHGTRSSLKALIRLFLKHHAKADQATIEVPTPQRLSQISSSSTLSSPRKTGGQVQRDLTPSFTAGGRGHGASKRSSSRSRSSRKAAGAQDSDGMGWLPEDPASQEDKAAGDTESEEEEEFESLPTDPLVFSREEFDTALNQAGQHMEDSIVASYAALLLGILAKHNQDSVDAIRREMPSKSFSEMIAVLRKFVSFMNIAGTSGTGLDSIRHIIKYLEAL